MRSVEDAHHRSVSICRIGSGHDHATQYASLGPNEHDDAGAGAGYGSSDDVEIALDDREAVVATAALARLTTDNSFGGEPVFDTVNIVDHYGTAIADASFETDPDAPLDPAVRAVVEVAVAPIRVSWIAELSDVIGTGQLIPSYEDVGAVLVFGEPTIERVEATIDTAVWCGSTCGAGGSMLLTRSSATDEWRVTATPRPQWTA